MVENHMRGHDIVNMKPGKAVKFMLELASRGILESFLKLIVADGTNQVIATKIKVMAEKLVDLREELKRKMETGAPDALKSPDQLLQELIRAYRGMMEGKSRLSQLDNLMLDKMSKVIKKN